MAVPSFASKSANSSSGGAPPALPIGSLLLGALALLGGSVWLALEPGVLLGYVGTPRLLALTHLFTIGFVTLVYLGTLQQLPAVLLVTELAWPRLGYLILPLALLGAAALVTGFATGLTPLLLGAGSTAVCLALGLALVQLLVTAAKRPPRDAAGRGLIEAVAYLFLAVLAGTVLAAARSSPAVATVAGYQPALHQTIGMAGAFLLGIAAAGQKLLSMFALSKGGASWRLRVLGYAVHVAMAAALLRAFAPLLGLAPSAAALLNLVTLTGLYCAAGLQCWEVVAILRRRLRRRLEAPVQRYVLAHAFLPLAGILLLFGLDTAAAAAFLLGFVGLAVSGMMVKILSFLTWTSVYAVRGQTRPPPLLRDLVVPALEPVITAGLAIGAILTTSVLAVGGELLVFATLAALSLAVGAGAQLAQVSVIIYRTLFGSREAPRAPSAATAVQK